MSIIDTDEIREENQPSAWLTLIVLVFAIPTGFFLIGPLVGVLFAFPFMEGSIFTLEAQMKDPTLYPALKTPLFIIQCFSAFVGMVLWPAFFWRMLKNKNPFSFIKAPKPPLILFLLGGLLVITFLPLDSVFIDWNTKFITHERFGSFADFAGKWEKQNGDLVKFLTSFDTPGQFAIAFFTISILAGFCEEFCFRGMVQPVLHKVTGNIHVAIWLTAFIFSAVHLQFFGFLPRMLLGVIFGYLYYWSGNILIPMVAHMVNNGLGLILILLNQKSITDFDPESTEVVPVPLIAGSTIVFAFLLFYYYRFTKNSKPAAA